MMYFLEAESIEKKQVLRSLIALKQENKPNLIAYIADQNTTIKNVHYWINFLNQDTAVQSGWATIARKFNTPVIYLKVKPIKKGYYTAHFEVITETPNLISEEDLIKSYFAKLERDIKELPEYWLWSHKRWKHKRIKSDTTNL